MGFTFIVYSWIGLEIEKLRYDLGDSLSWR